MTQRLQVMKLEAVVHKTFESLISLIFLKGGTQIRTGGWRFCRPLKTTIFRHFWLFDQIFTPNLPHEKFATLYVNFYV